MREILFRGYSTAERMWVYGDLSHTTDKTVHISNENCFIGVKPETVGQYTGLTDKNGKKIFEGDIVKIKDYSKGCALNYEQPTSNWDVKWNDKYAQFTIDYMSLLPYKHFDESEVIGNIHDNPELLKGGC